MKRFLTFLLVAAGAYMAFSDGTETAIVLDISRRNTTISLTYTECCDYAVRATVRNGGDDYPLTGYSINLVFGGSASGCIYEGIITNVNEVVFNIDAASIPTNGTYSVQVMAMKNRRSNEWGRGKLRVTANPGLNYMPSCWMGYQKVAALAASLISVDLITNEVVQAVATNTIQRGQYTFEPWTNECFSIGKSFVPGLYRGLKFFWDRTNSVPRVYRTALFPTGNFYTMDGTITNAYFEIVANGVRSAWTNNATGTFYPSTTNEVKKFNASKWYGNDTQFHTAIP